MSIQELTEIVRPPMHPVEPGSSEAWSELQQRLGIRLPDEIRDFGSAYGTGSFCGTFLAVFNPFANGYMRSLNDAIDSLRAAKERGMTFGVFPDNPGLFPWGRDENGNTYCWNAEGDPEHWQVAIRKHGSEDVIRIPMSMSTFLVKSFRNEISTDVWQGEPFSRDELTFVRRV